LLRNAIAEQYNKKKYRATIGEQKNKIIFIGARVLNCP
jgi:hypothetical protein